MFRMRFSLAVLGAIVAMGFSAANAEARHRRHQHHQQNGCGCQGHHMGYAHSGHSYSDGCNQQYSQPMNSNACCGSDQWHPYSRYQNQMSTTQTNAACIPAPMATPSVSNPAPGVVKPPQPAVSQVVVPAPAM